jgi:hypothetical protein
MLYDEKEDFLGLPDQIVGGSKLPVAPVVPVAPMAPVSVASVPSVSKILKKKKLFGGEEAKSSVLYIEYFQRWNIYFFIFFISVFLAILTMNNKNLVKRIFKVRNIGDLSQIEGCGNIDTCDNMKRWRKIILFTLIFILLVLSYNIGFIILSIVYFYLGGKMAKIPGTPSDKVANIFWRYKNQDGNDEFIGKSYFMIMLLVLFIVFISYMGFSKWYKDWFNNLYFQTTKNKKDPSQPQKYIYFYALFLITMMLFFMILLNIQLLESNGFMMYINFIFIGIYLVLTFVIIKEYEYGFKKKLGFIAILVAILFFFHPVILKLLLADSNSSELFGKDFLKSLIFNFTLPLQPHSS